MFFISIFFQNVKSLNNIISPSIEEIQTEIKPNPLACSYTWTYWYTFKSTGTMVFRNGQLEYQITSTYVRTSDYRCLSISGGGGGGLDGGGTSNENTVTSLTNPSSSSKLYLLIFLFVLGILFVLNPKLFKQIPREPGDPSVQGLSNNNNNNFIEPAIISPIHSNLLSENPQFSVYNPYQSPEFIKK